MKRTCFPYISSRRRTEILCVWFNSVLLYIDAIRYEYQNSEKSLQLLTDLWFDRFWPKLSVSTDVQFATMDDGSSVVDYSFHWLWLACLSTTLAKVIKYLVSPFDLKKGKEKLQQNLWPVSGFSIVVSVRHPLVEEVGFVLNMNYIKIL